jgi:hypothetical protein
MARATFNRAAFLSAATELQEDIVPSGPLGLGDIPIRELTAAQRLEAVEVAKVIGADGSEVALPDGSAKLDTAMYWAALIQMSVLDPGSCEWDGDTFVKGGAQLLTPEDIPDLAARGKEVLSVLAQRVINLSWLGRGDLFRSRQTADGEQPAAGADVAEPRNETDSEGSANGDNRAAVGARDVPDVGELAADGE